MIDGKLTKYLYDGWQVVGEVENGSLVASYIYDDGIDHPVATVRDGQIYYYHTDMRNNVAMLTDK